MPSSDPDKRKKYNREYYLKNREKLLAKRKEKYQANLEAERAKRKAYFATKGAKEVRRKYLQSKKQPCRKKYQQEWYFKKTYGLAPEDFQSLLERSNHCCEVCGKHVDDGNSPHHIDHCHKTGEIRGILCNPCNRGIGFLGDSLEGVRKALEYLERFEARDVTPKKRKPKHQPVRNRPDKKVGRLSPKTAGRQMSGVSRQARRKEVLDAGV